MAPPIKYWAVAEGRKTGIFLQWNQAHRSTDGYAGACHKAVLTFEAAAEFMEANGDITDFIIHDGDRCISRDDYQRSLDDASRSTPASRPTTIVHAIRNQVVSSMTRLRAGVTTRLRSKANMASSPNTSAISHSTSASSVTSSITSIVVNEPNAIPQMPDLNISTALSDTSERDNDLHIIII